MKTIIRTMLITIVLLGLTQDGYGTGSGTESDPRVLTSWDELLSSTNSTKNGSTYTLDKYSMYELKIENKKYLNSDIKLIIPRNVNVTNSTYMDVRSQLEITNNGTFNNNGDIQTYAARSITFSGSGDITNTGNIYTKVKNNYILFSAGTDETPQRVTTLGTQDSPGQIYLNPDNPISTPPNIAIGTYSILSFGDYGKFYAYCRLSGGTSVRVFGNVTLKGTIEIASINASVNITKMDISGNGTIDMSPLRSDSLGLTSTQEFDNHDFFTFDTSKQLPNIKLPFNCKFKTGLNLSNAAKVYYTVLKLCGVCIDDNVIKKDESNIIGTFGDYATQSLGVTLPQKNGAVDMDKVDITNEYVGSMSLSDLANDITTYNKSPNKLLTDDLYNATDTTESNTTRTYNFGFIGSTPIEISGNGKAVFNGDNSGYAPKDENDSPVEIELPDEVEFGANDSLFPFQQTYGHGTFKSLQELKDENPDDLDIQSLAELSNTIPAGAEVKFTNGFTLGAGHTLIVRGTLIG